MSQDGSFLQEFDLFAKNFELFFNKKKTLKTYYGGITSIITVTLSIVFLIVIGKEVIYKQNPFVISRELSFWNRTNLTLETKMAFTIETQSAGIVVENYDKYLTIESVYTNITYTYGFDVEIKETIIELENCEPKEFANISSQQFEFLNLNYAKCLNSSKEIIIGGFQDEYYNKYLLVRVKKCKNTTDNEKCATHDEIEEFLKNNDLQFTVYFQRLQFDFINYAKPESYFISGYFKYFDGNIKHSTSFFLQSFQLVTDGGILYSDIWNKTFQQFDYMTEQSSIFLNSNQEHSFVEYFFYTSENDYIFQRHYIRVQEILAQFGGLLKVVIILLDFILNLIYKRKMIETIITNLFYIRKSDFESGYYTRFKDNRIFKSNKTIEELKPDDLFNKIYGNVSDRKLEQPYKDVNSKTDKNFLKGKISEKISNSLDVECSDNNTVRIIKTSLIPENNQFKNPLFALENLIKKKEKLILDEKNGDKFILTDFEHLISIFCHFISSKNLIRKETIYNLLIDQVLDYIDIIKLSKSLLEIEKLKFVLLNKEQLALFNMISNPESPLKIKLTNKLSDLYNYTFNEKEQLKYANNYVAKGKKLSQIDRNLLELLV
jgi:hypothetical protein